MLTFVVLTWLAVIAVAAGGSYALNFFNSAGTKVAKVTADGVVTLKDSCAYGGTCTITSGTCDKITDCNSPAAKSFVIRNNWGFILAWINSTGGMCCIGDITQNQQVNMAAFCPTNAFRVFDNGKNKIFCIDSSGNCYSNSTIRCNGSP